jgi:hypothetical protein
MNAVTTLTRPRSVDVLARSPLARAGGVLVVDQPSGWAEALRSEVSSLVDTAVPAQIGASRSESDPYRVLHHLAGGPRLDAVYLGGEMQALLHSVTDVHWAPQGSRGSYSIYTAGCHLGAHRDLPGCDLTAIVVVEDTTPGGHALWCWPSRAKESLADIERDRSRGRVDVVGRPGQMIVVLGRVVPHLLPPIPAGAQRIVSPLCFTLVPD